jgi:4-oxalocrotonate tautomerase
MPFAQIYILEGRTEAQKRAVIEKVTQALVEAIGAPIENVRVWIHEVPKANWGIAGVSAKDRGR